MATGITIDEVTNTLDDIQGTEKIPVSSGISEPEVVTTGTLKEYINDGMQTEISDLNTIRSGATAGASAYQKPSSGIPSTDLASDVQTSLGKADTALQSFTETDPTVPSWAKSSSKPSYNYSEISGTPTLANVATSGSYNDLSNTPTIPTVPTISTDISSDATSDDKTASPKAVKTFVEGKGYITSAHEVPAGGNAGQVLSKVSATDYDTHWVNQTTTYPSAYSTTAGGTAAKKASCSLFALQTNSYVHILIAISNTSASALTLSINSTTAKPIYINGVASSATNYTLPAGTYIVFYDGTNYYFRTDGKIQAPNGTLVSTSSTSGLIKNDGTIDTTSYGTYSKPSGGIPAADLASGVIPTVPSNIVVGSSQSYTIAVVASMPATPDANTIYLVTGS